MKIHLYLLLIAGILALSCGESTATEQTVSTADPASEQGPAFTDLGVAEFRTKMQDPEIVILDVRTPEETADGMIEGALESNVLEEAAFTSYLAGLDKDKTYLVYCRSGRRSVKACEMMAGQGFTRLYNLEGGYLAWEKAREKK